MGLWTKQQLREFIKENKLVTAQDAQNALKNLFAETIQEMLEAEMDTHLGYQKHEVENKQTSNSRNGKSKKRVTSEYGEQEIMVPRDRQGEFEALVVKKHQSNVTGIEDQIIALYAKGVSTRDIQDHLENLYGIEVSPTLISNVTNKDLKKVTADLKPIYKAASEEMALVELDRFEEAWGTKYPLILRSWRNNWDELATFFKYPPEIRKLIYTTNIIESYHRQLRKVTKGKSIFPTDEALLKMLYLATMDVTRKWTGRVQNWGQMLLQLSVFFPDRIGQHLR
ncbi:transposase [Paenibacillus filicis]|uniref:Mutator family transposase n=1 Tax=Paenibacillus filicis TaxID=669464 RepID=A0ABU9DRB2_9BACL